MKAKASQYSLLTTCLIAILISVFNLFREEWSIYLTLALEIFFLPSLYGTAIGFIGITLVALLLSPKKSLRGIFEGTSFSFLHHTNEKRPGCFSSCRINPKPMSHRFSLTFGPIFFSIWRPDTQKTVCQGVICQPLVGPELQVPLTRDPMSKLSSVIFFTCRFPVAHFGRLLGIMIVAGSIVQFTQVPLLRWAEKDSFTTVNNFIHLQCSFCLFL